MMHNHAHHLGHCPNLLHEGPSWSVHCVMQTLLIPLTVQFLTVVHLLSCQCLHWPDISRGLWRQWQFSGLCILWSLPIVSPQFNYLLEWPHYYYYVIPGMLGSNFFNLSGFWNHAKFWSAYYLPSLRPVLLLYCKIRGNNTGPPESRNWPDKSSFWPLDRTVRSNRPVSGLLGGGGCLGSLGQLQAKLWPATVAILSTMRVQRWSCIARMHTIPPSVSQGGARRGGSKRSSSSDAAPGPNEVLGQRAPRTGSLLCPEGTKNPFGIWGHEIEF